MRELIADVVLHPGAQHGEGPVWLDDVDLLLWVDITRGHVHRSDPERGADEVVDVGQHVGAAVPRQTGGLALALADGFALWGEDERPQVVAPVVADRPDLRFNDGKCDPVGRFVAGTMAYDARPGAGALYGLDSDGSVTTLLTGVTISNGLAWSADGRTLYYIDSPTQRVDAFDYDPEAGSIANRRPVLAVPSTAGLPDGMTIDGDGCLWVALYGGGAVHRYSPQGVLDTVVTLPVSQVTSCTFGGPRLDRLYITTSTEDLTPAERRAQAAAGAVFACDPGTSGMPAHPFAA